MIVGSLALLCVVFCAMLFATWCSHLRDCFKSLRDRVEKAEAKLNELNLNVGGLVWDRMGNHRNQIAAAEQFKSLEARILEHDRASGGFWITGRGKTIRIRDMGHAHIVNCLAYLSETPGLDKQKTAKSRQELSAELARRCVNDSWNP